jgi:outer membrane protein
MLKSTVFGLAVLASLGSPLCSVAQELVDAPVAQNSPTPPVQPPVFKQRQQTSPSAQGPQANAGAATSLTLKQAEEIAIKNNPQISAAQLIALASQQVTRQVRSALWPTASGEITGVDAESGRRISAGALNNPVIYSRVAAGAIVSQLITDFGRTANLISSSNYAAKAQNENAVATQQQILLAVNQAFYNALQAQAILTVAQKTVDARQTVASQVDALFRNKLKSELDLSFANVNLAQAQLLLLDAQNNASATQATLSMVLGFPTVLNFQLVGNAGQLAPPPEDVDGLTSQALSVRPEIRSLQFQYQGARKFQSAERDLLLPNIRALAAVGDTPAGDLQVAPNKSALSNTYGAVGANIEIPIFNGFLYQARARDASLRTEATQERLLDLRNLISRDVRASWLNAKTAYQRLAVTRQLLQQATLAMDLAQSRYNLGLSSIVELTQAQLQLTQAEISDAQAGYDYQLGLAVLMYQTTGI